jgi:hypothetical protein
LADQPASFPGPSVFGSRAAHPRAATLADEAHRALYRYATEVVARFGLCPFLHNVDTGMGAVGIVLDVEPDVETAARAVEALGANVVHLVFPIARISSTHFERFGSKLATALQARLREPLVHATFHPELVGGTENAHRLIGLLRRAPDPFVQFIPPGLHEGGTVLIGEPVPAEGRAEATFRRLAQGPVSEVLAKLDELHTERALRYASLAKEVGDVSS